MRNEFVRFSKKYEPKFVSYKELKEIGNHPAIQVFNKDASPEVKNSFIEEFITTINTSRKDRY